MSQALGRMHQILLPLLAWGLLLPQFSHAEEDQPASLQSEFHFTRLAVGAYGHRPGGGRGEPWLRDWPDADYHFLQGVRRLTRLDAAGKPHYVSLTDDSLFDYPVIYAVKVGFWRLNKAEATQLREYLLRGGFLIVDDFHGPGEWAEFAASMQRVFWDRSITEIPGDDEIFHVLYDLDQRVQIPGRQAVLSGRTWEVTPLAVPGRWRGVYDDDGRMLVAINFNMDLGDAWEHADDGFYPEPLTALAYRFGVNYIIYSMTH